MSKSYAVAPIATVSCSRVSAFDDNWDAETTAIQLDSSVLDPSAAAGLTAFSHIEVLFVFHEVQDEKIVTGARHPRGNPDWPKIGILAQRGKNRPNRMGMTVCELVSVDGLTITVKGLDAIDGTPVIDIKPVMSGFLPRTQVTEPDWAREIMRDYWQADQPES